MNKKKLHITGIRTDLALEKNRIKTQHLYYKKDIEVFEMNKKNIIYHFINFNIIDKNLKDILKKELTFFIDRNKANGHFFIIGLGNDNYTADSVGPKSLKFIKANSYLKEMGIKLNGPCISLLEPGVLGQTGIESSRIIESVAKEIKPDLIILIDSYVSKNVKNLNKLIQITNEGIIPGSGLKTQIFSEISFNTIGIPTIVIGVPTALEFSINKKKLIVSTNDVDLFVLKISQVIGEAINEFLYHN